MNGNTFSNFQKYALRRAKLEGIGTLDKYNPFFETIEPQANFGTPKSRISLSFAHYDYLGLAEHPNIRKSAIDAINEFGTGVGASRLVGGERHINSAFEEHLADFLQQPAVMTLVSGYLTNLTLLNHVVGRRDLVIADELAHNSIMAALRRRLPGTTMTYAHNNLDHLETLLETNSSDFPHVFIVAESLYSMDGDLVDLPRLVALKQRYKCFLILDEAHAIGVVGKNGRGGAEHFGLDPRDIDIVTGSLSKSFVSAGGFIATNKEADEWLRYTLPGFVFSVGIAPTMVASAHAALRVMQQEPERIQQLTAISRYFLYYAREQRLNLGNALGLGIVPIMFDSEDETIWVAQTLMQAGIYAPPIIRVGIPRELPRIRFFLNANHTQADVTHTIDIVIAALTAFRQSQGSVSG